MLGGRSKEHPSEGESRKDVVAFPRRGLERLMGLRCRGKFKRRIRAEDVNKLLGKEFRVVSLSDVTHGETTITGPELMMLSEARSVKL